MKNPIIYSDNEQKYIVWVSYWGIKVMKYFLSPEDAINYIRLNPNRCMGINNPASQEQLNLWLSELESITHSETENDKHEDQKIEEVQKSSKIWLYALVFVAVFIFNFLNNPDSAVVTLISSITQVVILLAIVGVFLGIKWLFRHGK